MNDKSVTYKIIKSITEKVRTECIINNITPMNKKVYQCRGCSKCFYTGKCQLAGNDDMQKNKEMIKEADLVIIGSPVYLASISGSLKVFLDRVAYWTHLLYLKGKPTVIVLTSSGNGSQMAIDYLSYIVSCMGAKIISRINFEYKNDDEINEFINSYDAYRAAELIDRFLKDSTAIKSDEFLDKYFVSLKNNIRRQDNSSAEYQYWQDNGYLEMNSFQEIIDSSKK